MKTIVHHRPEEPASPLVRLLVSLGDAMLFDVFRRFAKDRRGNVAMYFGLAAVPLIFAIGMAIDYGNNARKWSQLNAAADAAALAAVTPAMLLQSDATATTAATDMFNGQISGMTNVTITKLTVGPPVDSGLTRTMTVSYQAQITNIFGSVLGQSTMPASGSATASGSTPPSIDFYLLLDTSPSMAIPFTQNGINTMIANTQQQSDGNEKGCAFACHESNPSAEPVPLGNPNGEDNYALAKSLTDPDTGATGIDLRIDELGKAASAMVGVAIQAASQNQTNYGWTGAYRIAVSTFNTGINKLYPITTPLSTLQSNLAANPSPIQLMEVYSNNNICTSWQTSKGVTTCQAHTNNNDTDTNIDAALTALNNSSDTTDYIPNPGTGASGSPPAEILMIVTDGMEDECVSSITSGTTVSCPGGSRQEAPMAASSATTSSTTTPSQVPSVATCAAIKARGIKIAVL
ncbi:MAG: hypothetical protein JO237_07920, partial [Pseudolabrys sp.]|nr:hypothetical protein [Pseudolabrys sp.]